jgi:hypothetical protein
MRITPMWPGFDTTGGARPAGLDAFENAAFPEFATEIVPDLNDNTNADGVVQNVDHRQLFARHLYVLALTLTAEETFGLPQDQGGDAQKDQEVARRVAQWAINVVDFRDPDNIMTAFEYDPNPFNGWDCVAPAPPTPGNPNSPPKINGIPDAQYALDNPDVQLVWGAERPELVMTETVAWHDRRTDNTGSENVFPPGEQPELMDKEGTEEDRDYDQLVRPRGVALVEIHNPWPTSPSANADTHRVNRNILGSQVVPNVPEGADMGVDLGRTHSGQPDGHPVWRMMVYKRGDPTATKKATAADAALWDPDSPDPKKRPTVPPNRSVYFTGRDPERLPGVTWEEDGVAFFNDRTKNPVPPVRPGRFLVVGAGDEKAAGEYNVPIGDRKGARNPDNPNRDRLRRFVLDTNNVPHRIRLVDADAATTTIEDSTLPPGSRYAMQAPGENNAILEKAFVGDANPCVTDVAIIDQAIDEVTGQPVKRNFTVSEPAHGYPNKFRGSTWDAAKQEYDATNGFPAIDIPLDGPIGGAEALEAQLELRDLDGDMERGNWPSYLAEFDRQSRKWISHLDEVLCQIPEPGTTSAPYLGASYANIYLQRLANPLLPWNPPAGDPKHRAGEAVNPYLTVDSTAPNLAVFNSRGDDSGEEEDGTPASDARYWFAGHERGYTDDRLSKSATTRMPSLWREEEPSFEKDQNRNDDRPKAKIDSVGPPRNQFNIDGQRPTLAASNDYWFHTVPLNTLGFLNRAFHDTARNGEARQLAPQKPYEWFSWNNRPFATGNEIMQVPRGRALQMLRTFSNAEQQIIFEEGQSSLKPPLSPYVAPTGELDKNGYELGNPRPPYAHLENFFYEHQESPPPATTPPMPRGTVAHMYRVLDYVHTPSLFVGTKTWLNPSQGHFGAPISTRDANALRAATMDARLSFQPPFNVVSEFRDPGRVNINTISGEAAGATPTSDVWNGLFHVDDNPDRKIGNKRHAGPAWSELADSRGGYAGAVNLELNSSLPTMFSNPYRSPDAGDLVPLDDMRRVGVDVSLLRSMNSTKAGPAGPTPKLLFESEPVAGNEFADPVRNPFFQYQPITRLANLVTTRSNVYAVWVTIGFFEVEPAKPWADMDATEQGRYGTQAVYNKVYPGGYMFAKEDGIDTGEIRRLRGFYMIDRTMPAGFEPGVDHNVENVIRLRRRIE